MNITSKSHRYQAGFTIVELMIATLVFSVILMVITGGVTQFTKNYYKGINASNNQTVTANALNTITQSLQFSAVAPTTVTALSDDTTNTEYYFCAGSKEFVFSKGYKPSNDAMAIPHYGLVMFDNATCTEPTIATLNSAFPGWSQRQQLLQSDMRVTDLQLSKLDPSNGITNSYTVSLTVAYGDGDLFCSRDDMNPAACTSKASFGIDAQVAGDTNAIACTTQSGSQFCNISQLSSAVRVRVQ